ncbi:MAG: SusC/RagA family TonB-linked outer membrane protein [Bacteroidota bacterium]
MKYLSLIVTLLLFQLQLFSQVEVTGTVTDGESGEPLPGTTVSVEGTATGTITGMDGEFSINASSEEDVLVVSFIGYETQRVSIGSQRNISITLNLDVAELEEVVVTALGIKREKKSLGYSVQDVSGEDVSKTNPDNVVSALSGKIAGAQIVTSSGQVGASSTIQIRGNKSLTGNKQPLFVVDGTPIMNGISSARNTDTYTDFGNAAMDIDPANIESMSVLKGPSATALYGSRAANGVVLITTKKGAGKKGIGVEFNTSLAFDEVYILPNYQNEYGQGVGGSEYLWQKLHPDLTYQEFNDRFGFAWATDGSGRGSKDDLSWGARLDEGLMIPQFDSPVNADGTIEATPWVSHPDNIKNFYETGISHQHNLALVSGNENASGRLTIGLADQKGTSPNTDQTKINVGLNSHFQLSEKISFDVNTNYTNLKNDNLPQQGNSMRNPLLEFNSWFGRQVDTKHLKDRYNDIILYEGEERAYNWMMGYPNQHPNPYWNAYKNTMSRSRNRVYGNAAINIELIKGVALMGRIGTDFFNEHRRYINHKYSRDWTDLYEFATNGNLWEQFRLESETNADLLLKINRELTEDFSLFATIGGNYRVAYDQFATTYGQNLIVADFFSTSNFAGEPTVSFTRYKKVTNSVFGSANLGFKRYLFLDLTLRGDWSSTLPRENWNYWYPSVNLGFIVTDAFNIESDVISYIKLRGGYAVVGDDTSPYKLSPVYYSQGNTTFNGVNMFGAQSTLPTYALKPELTNSVEFGGEFKFFMNRLGIDVTYYDALTTNQLIKVGIPYSSGYSGWFKNVGSIRNKGVELQVYGSILKSVDGLSWDVNLNWSTNYNTVVELEDGLEELKLTSYFNDNDLMAFPGDEWGAIYGTTFLKNEAGEILVDRKGNPGEATDPEILGYVNPDWIGGVGNTLSFRGLSLYMLIDFRKGGDMYSMTKAVGQFAGILQSTVEGGVRETGMIVPGIYEEGARVDLDGDGTREEAGGLPNQSVISAASYWESSRPWAELSIVDGSFVKLREVSLAYRLPGNLVSKAGIQQATLSVFGRNLALLYTHESNDAHIDPEVSSGGTLGGIGLEAYQLPPNRTIGVKLSLKF